MQFGGCEIIIFYFEIITQLDIPQQFRKTDRLQNRCKVYQFT